MSLSLPMNCREITATDVPALFDVRTCTRENAYTMEQLRRLGITAESVTEKLATTCKGWLSTDADQVVAFCIADNSTAELWVIAVLPQYEGRGIGNELMRRAEQWLCASGCAKAWLTTDIDTTLRAYGFYRHRGWTDWKVESGLRWMQLVLSPPAVTATDQP
jgi:ribosomal protein S18 acetylase RimI-like enzyme